MSLVPPAAYASLFEPLRGFRVGFVSMKGNAGDHMIDLAARQLFDYFNISHRPLSSANLVSSTLPGELDEIVVSGGGNMGRFYGQAYRLRQSALSHGLPVTVLPQSFITTDEDISRYKKVYVREHFSQSLFPELELAPDLALALSVPEGLPPPECKTGLFLRRDAEGRFLDHHDSLPDPVDIHISPLSYIKLAAGFEHVISDRLHFCIAALIAGRRATLLPNSYGKNEAMFNSWLEDLGCEWRSEPPTIDKAKRQGDLAFIIKNHRLNTKRGLPSSAEPKLLPGWNIRSHRGEWYLTHPKVTNSLHVSQSTVLVLELFSLDPTVGGITRRLTDQFTVPPENLATDVAEMLCSLTRAGVVDFEWNDAGRA